MRALADGTDGACQRAQRSLVHRARRSLRSFELEDGTGSRSAPSAKSATPVQCRSPHPATSRFALPPAPMRSRSASAWSTAWRQVMSRSLSSVRRRRMPAATLRRWSSRRCPRIRVIGPPAGPDLELRISEWPLGNGNLIARIGVAAASGSRAATSSMLLLPLLMWVAAAMIAWLVVSRLLVRPLKRLERAVVAYRPGEGALDLPRSSAQARRSRSCATPLAAPSAGSRSPSGKPAQRWMDSEGSSARSITG